MDPNKQTNAKTKSKARNESKNIKENNRGKTDTLLYHQHEKGHMHH